MWGSVFLKCPKFLGRHSDGNFGEPWEGRWGQSLPSNPLGRYPRKSENVSWCGKSWRTVLNLTSQGKEQMSKSSGFHQSFSTWPSSEVSGVADVWQLNQDAGASFPLGGKSSFHLGKEAQAPSVETNGGRLWVGKARDVGGMDVGQGLGKGRLRSGDHDSSFTTFIKLPWHTEGSGHSKALVSPRPLVVTLVHFQPREFLVLAWVHSLSLKWTEKSRWQFFNQFL